jgi:hypothetical protein
MKKPRLEPMSISIDEDGAIESKQWNVVSSTRFKQYGREVLFRLKKLKGFFSLREIDELKQSIEADFAVEVSWQDEKEPGE